MRVYVAGSSGEQARVRRVMDALRAAGIEVAHDWVALIDAMDGRANEGLDRDEREEASQECCDRVAESNLLLLLVPYHQSIGAWVELGVAKASGLILIASGLKEDLDETIFSSLCSPTFTQPSPPSFWQIESAQARADGTAIAWLIDNAREIEARV